MKLTVFISLMTLFFIYSAIVYTSGTETVATKMNDSAIEGKLLFQKHNCTACHQLYGLGGYLGPELTTVLSQPGRELYARAILQTGTQRMPNFKLSERDINCIVEFLKYVDATAVTYIR
jgi:nitric oxide reductase subunit C